MGLLKRKYVLPLPIHPIDVKPCPVCGINAVGLNDVNCIKCFLELAFRGLIYALMVAMAILVLLRYLEPKIETPISCYPDDWMGPVGPPGLSPVAAPRSGAAEAAKPPEVPEPQNSE